MRGWYWLFGLALATTATAEEFTTFKGHGGPVMGLTMSRDGALISASFDNSVGAWSDGEPTWLEGHDAAVVSVNAAFADVILSGGDDFRVLAWPNTSDVPIEVTKHLGKVAEIAVWPAGQRIASAGWDGFVHVTDRVGSAPWSPSNFETQVLKGHQSNVTTVGFSSDGVLYSASSDGTLRVWEGSDLTPRTIVKHGFGINEMIVTDRWIAYGAIDGGTRVITREGEEIKDFTLDRRPILSMAYHPQTHQLAVGDGHGYIMMIDTEAWRISRDFRAMRKGPVWALAFSEDGQTIHAGGIDDVIYVWPVAFLDQFDPVGGERSFLRPAAEMTNGERQFMRKCSICHAVAPGPSRKAGPNLYGVFGRQAGTVAGYPYSQTLTGSDIIWDDTTIDALFDIGPDHYIPGSKMPMQVIAAPSDRADLVAYLREVTKVK